jgi:hypothetical protein
MVVQLKGIKKNEKENIIVSHSPRETIKMEALWIEKTF